MGFRGLSHALDTNVAAGSTTAEWWRCVVCDRYAHTPDKMEHSGVHFSVSSDMN